MRKIGNIVYVCSVTKARSAVLKAFTELYATYLGLDLQVGAVGANIKDVKRFTARKMLGASNSIIELAKEEDLPEIHNKLLHHKIKEFTPKLGELSDIILSVDQMNLNRILKIYPYGKQKRKVMLASEFAGFGKYDIIDAHFGQGGNIYKGKILTDTYEARKMMLYECGEIAYGVLSNHPSKWYKLKNKKGKVNN